MQAKDFKVGDTVRALDSIFQKEGLLKGETGRVLSVDRETETAEVVHSRNSYSWTMRFSELEVIKVSPPTPASDLRLTPQAKDILKHLKKRSHISPAEAQITYGISRLASCIHEIRRKAGYNVKTEVRRDEAGHKYANYSLVA